MWLLGVARVGDAAWSKTCMDGSRRTRRKDTIVAGAIVCSLELVVENGGWRAVDLDVARV